MTDYPNPYAKTIGCLVSLCLLLFVLLSLAMFSRLDSQIAVNRTQSIDRDLGSEVEAAQHMTTDQSHVVVELSTANKNNKDATGNLAVNLAQATKTSAEAGQINDDRTAKQVGYGGLALENLAGVDGIPSLGVKGFLCLGSIFFVGILFGAYIFRPYRRSQ